MNEETNTIQTLKLPYLKDRVKAYLIDIFVMIVMAYVFSLIFDSVGTVEDNLRKYAFLFVLLYEPLFTSLGCTLGQFIAGLRVRKRKNTSSKIPLHLAVLRFIVKLILGWISLITVSFNKNKRAIHDMAVGSIVVIK